MECVLYFEVADDTMMSRLLKRAETSGRADDNEETIAKRLKTFHSITQPVIDFYSQQGKVCQVSRPNTFSLLVLAHSTYYPDRLR